MITVAANRRPAPAYRYVIPAVMDAIGSLAPGTRVLDIGCGDGHFAARFDELGCEVVGVDPTPHRVERARSLYPGIRFEQLEARSDLIDQLGEAPFDLVISTEVLEHVYAPDELAQGAFRALADGGRFVLSTPYHGYLKNLVIAASGKSDSHHQPLQTGGHIKFFSRSAAYRLLKRAGFRNLRFSGAGRIPGLWKSMVICGSRRGSDVDPAD